MSILNSLKLVAAKQQCVMDPVQQRRAKLVTKLDEQIALAQARAEGKDYAPTRATRVTDAEGNVTTVQAPKRVKAWTWAIEGGRVCVAVRYGNRVIELAKGKTAVEVAAGDVVGVLGKLRDAAAAGELDAGMEAAAAGVRRAFKR